MHFSRSRGATRWLAQLLILIGLGFLVYWTYRTAAPAFEEVARMGYGYTGGYSSRDQFNSFLRFVTTFLYVITGLTVASSAAAAVSSEREEDTWLSLITTELSGAEILTGKMFGAFWSVRFFLFILVTLWGIGLAAGAIHPFGVIAQALDYTIYLWFASALGTALSLRARNTTRAMATTVGLLLGMNVGYLMCCIPFGPDKSVFFLVGCTPFLTAISLMSYADLWNLLGFETQRYYGPGSHRGQLLFTCLFSLILYGMGALVLTLNAMFEFDRIVDRPRPPLWNVPAPEPKKAFGPSTEV